MPQFNIVTPTGVGIGKNAPDDNTIFRDSQDNTLAMIQNGYLYHLNPETILTPDEMKQAGTWGTALMMMNKKLGINPSNFPAYNVADLMDYLYQYHTSRGEAVRQGGDLIKDLSGSQAQQMISSGQIAKTDAGVKTLTATETPKIISGANGPVDANGNPINLEDYAKYGITDNKIPTTGGRVNTAGISQGGDSAEFQRYLKDKNITDPTVIAQYREQWQTMGAPPGYEGQQAAEQAPTGGQAQAAQYQILDLEAMKKYTPDQYERLTDGSVVLKDGVTPIPGTTKPYGGTTGVPGQVPTGGGQTGGEAPTGGTTETGVPGVTIPSDTDVIAQNQTSLKDANAIIDNSNLPQSLKDVYKGVLAAYPEGIEYNPTEIINAFNKIKEETVDPYYRQQISLAQEDFNQALSKTKTDRTTELEAERATAGQTIRQAKAGLEKAGKTFTGEAIETLGKESAYAQKPTEGAETVPKQEPFGGLFYEGDIPQSSRLLATSSQARYEANLANLGLAAEAKLGTSGLTALNVPGYKPVGGVTGTLEEEKTGREAATLNDLLEQYRQKRASLQRVEV